MNNSSPDHRLTPLLNQVHTNDDESYMAPPSQLSLSQQEEGVTNDLDPTNHQVVTSTTVTSNPSDGHNEEIDYSQLPPLISYCSFIKYGWTFGKWLLLVCVVNIVAILVIPEFLQDYPLHFFYPFAIIWFSTSAWFFWSAKVVERDLKGLDCMTPYEEARQTDEEEVNGGDQNEANSNNYFDLKYDNIYGRVSRYIDKAWSSNLTTSPLEPSSTPATSSLVNFAYIFWALFATYSFAAATIAVLAKIYESECKAVEYYFDFVMEFDCVMNHSGIFVIIITCVVLLACTVWMIFREGIPSGIVPFIYIPVAIFCGLNEYDSGNLSVIFMTVGTISFHMIIGCGVNSRTCNFSSLTHEMLIWALYSYLTAFLIFDRTYYYGYRPNSSTFAIVYIVLTTVILDHPLLNIVGFILILFSILSLNGVIFICGFGLIGVSGFLSNLRRNQHVLACCHALNQYVVGQQGQQ